MNMQDDELIKRAEHREVFSDGSEQIRLLVKKNRLASEEVEQLRVQLAGCLTAADGAISDPATHGMYGWSPAYQAVLELRRKYDAMKSTFS